MVNTELLGRGGGYSRAGDREGRQDGQKGVSDDQLCPVHMLLYMSTAFIIYVHRASKYGHTDPVVVALSSVARVAFSDACVRVVPRMIAHGASTVSFIAGVLAGFLSEDEKESASST